MPPQRTPVLYAASQGADKRGDAMLVTIHGGGGIPFPLDKEAGGRWTGVERAYGERAFLLHLSKSLYVAARMFTVVVPLILPVRVPSAPIPLTLLSGRRIPCRLTVIKEIGTVMPVKWQRQRQCFTGVSRLFDKFGRGNGAAGQHSSHI